MFYVIFAVNKFGKLCDKWGKTCSAIMSNSMIIASHCCGSVVFAMYTNDSAIACVYDYEAHLHSAVVIEHIVCMCDKSAHMID